MTIKIDFEFKQGDYVELAGMSEEQVEAVFNKMVQDGGQFYCSREESDLSLIWDFENDIYYGTYVNYGQHSCECIREGIDHRFITIKDIFPEYSLEELSNIDQELGLYDTDMENCKTSLEESITFQSGASIKFTEEEPMKSMIHDVQYIELPFDLQDPTTWKCFKEVAATLGAEDAEYELGKVLRQINEEGFGRNGDCEDSLRKYHLEYAFEWEWSVQGYSFWNSICNGIKSEGYDSTPDTPPTPEVDKKATPALKELNVEGSLEVRSQTLGELVEAIQTNIPPHIGIHFQPDGEVLLESDNAYVVVSELTAKEIDSAIEFVAHYGHLVIGKNDVQD